MQFQNRLVERLNMQTPGHFGAGRDGDKLRNIFQYAAQAFFATALLIKGEQLGQLFLWDFSKPDIASRYVASLKLRSRCDGQSLLSWCEDQLLPFQPAMIMPDGLGGYMKPAEVWSKYMFPEDRPSAKKRRMRLLMELKHGPRAAEQELFKKQHNVGDAEFRKMARYICQVQHLDIYPPEWQPTEVVELSGEDAEILGGWEHDAVLLSELMAYLRADTDDDSDYDAVSSPAETSPAETSAPTSPPPAAPPVSPAKSPKSAERVALEHRLREVERDLAVEREREAERKMKKGKRRVSFADESPPAKKQHPSGYQALD